MHGLPPPHETSDRGLQVTGNAIPPNHGQTGSNDITKTFGGLSLSSSNASLDGIGGVNISSNNAPSIVTSTQFKKLSLSGIQEFVPSSSSNVSPHFMSGSQHGMY